MSWNKSLKTIVNLPDSITHIGTNGFYQNEVLNLDALPKSLEIMGESAFEGCKALSISNVPLGVTAILENTFSGCSSLKMTDFGHSLAGELSGNDNNIETIDCGAFCNAGSGLPDNTIYFHDSLIKINLPTTPARVPPFESYGGATGNTRLSLIVENTILRDSINTRGDKYFGEDYYANHIILTQD
jgi:hypothetical protein